MERGTHVPLACHRTSSVAEVANVIMFQAERRRPSVCHENLRYKILQAEYPSETTDQKSSLLFLLRSHLLHSTPIFIHQDSGV